MYSQIYYRVVLGRPFFRNTLATITAALALCLILAQTAAADNLITNPGFESGTTGWSGFGCSFTTSSTVYHSDNQSGYLLLPKQSITTISMTSDWGWRPLSSGINDPVCALTVYNDKLIAGMWSNGVDTNCTAQWDGNNWQPLGSGMNGGYHNPNVRALTVYNDKLIAGGHFYSAGGVTAYSVAGWDGNNWQAVGSGLDYDVLALTVYNGELIAGGYAQVPGFSSNGEQYADDAPVDTDYIARFDSNDWQALGSGIDDGAVETLTVYNGELIAGGSFTTAGGVDANLIARWNGSGWQPLGSGMNHQVCALTVYNGELIAGGDFTTAGGVAANNIACWNGNNWQPLSSGMNGVVRALTVYNGELIAGGGFKKAGGVDVNCIARWDGSNWQPLGSGMNGPVNALTVYEGELIAGGSFTTAGGIPANNIARWGLPVNYKGDLNHDSIVDMLDLDWFSGHWLESDCFVTGWCYEADLNCDFVVDFQDYAIFAEQWLNGS